MSIEILFKEENDRNNFSINTVFDLANCCRTCLRQECSLTPTNSSDSDSIKFCDKLAACVSGMKWAKEGTPSFICGLCIEKLRVAYDFQTVCLQSDQTLQLQGEASEIQSSKSATPDPTTTTGLAECDKTIENVILNIKAEEMQIQPLEAMQTLDNPYKEDCQLCGEDLSEHNQRHTDNKCCQCSVRLKVDLLMDMHSRAEERAFACSYCDEEFTRKCPLNSYLEAQTGDKLWRHLICNKSNTKSFQPARHTKAHTGEKFPCKLCDKKFTWSAGLRVHMKKHAGEKFSCKLCDKKFTEPSTLKVHMKKHTGEKFTCKLCDRKFNQSSSLSIHMKKHAGEKFSCKFCDKKFTESSTLRVHMKRHTGEKFSCKLCDKKFTWPAGLRVHMKKHTGEKFSCTLCDKEFTQPSSLDMHIKTHTGEKFSCKLCDKKFAYRTSLNAHMKRHTGDKL